MRLCKDVDSLGNGTKSHFLCLSVGKRPKDFNRFNLQSLKSKQLYAEVVRSFSRRMLQCFSVAGIIGLNLRIYSENIYMALSVALKVLICMYVNLV